MDRNSNRYTNTTYLKQETKEYRWTVTNTQSRVEKSPVFTLPTVTYSLTLLHRHNNLVLIFGFRRNPHGGYLSVKLKLLNFDDTYVVNGMRREIIFPNTSSEEEMFVVAFKVTHIYSQSGTVFNSKVERQLFLKKYISSLYLKMELKDLFISIEDSLFPVHKIILASQSPKFQEMVYSLPFNICKLNLPDITIEDFKIILRYIYTCEIEITDHNINKIISIAVRFEINSLVKLCIDFLINNMNVENVINALCISHQHSIIRLENICLQFINTNRKQIRSMKQYENIKNDLTIIGKLLSSLSL